MEDNFDVGIVSFAHVHAPAYAKSLHKIKRLNFKGIYDRDNYRGTGAAGDFNTKYYRNYGDLLDEVEAVIVTSENLRHGELVKKAAPEVDAILCEKPLAPNPGEANQIIEKCEKHDTKLYTAFPMRHSPPVQSLKESIKDGKLGEIQGLSGTNQGTLPPGWFQERDLAGGGALMDHIVHLADIFHWAFDLEVKTVYTRSGTLLHHIEVEDSGVTTLQFKDGAFATIDSSWSRPDTYPAWGNLRLRVYGSEGVMNLDGFGQKFTHYNDTDNEINWKYWGTDSDREMLKDFARTLLEDRDSKVLATGESGKEAIKVVDAAYRSAESGEPVQLE